MKPDIIEDLPPTREAEGPLSRRLGWFVALWFASVAVLTLVAMTIKWAIL